MKTVGVIVEYNPLHNGHVYHIERSKAAAEADAVVAVMSGHFLQRGEPAIVNKWARAEMALHQGVDLVIELPVAFSASPADLFAFGAVSALDAAGIVDSLCFGSESGDIGLLSGLVQIMADEPAAFTGELKRLLKAGQSYPRAYSSAMAKALSSLGDAHFSNGEQAADALQKPNNMLGLQYMTALRKLNSRIVPLTTTRIKADYNQTEATDQQIASATAIRKMLFEEMNPQKALNWIPDSTLDILQREWSAGRAPIDWNRFFHPLLLQMFSKTPEELHNIHEMSEGLEYRLKQALIGIGHETSRPMDEWLMRIKTKRYTRTKLQRTLLRLLLNHSRDMLASKRLAQGVPYLRVLGFSEKGRFLLKRMKTSAKVPVVTKVAKEPSPFMEMDIRATSVYALAYSAPSGDDFFRDYYAPPIKV